MISDSVDLYQPFGVLLGVLHRTQHALESSGRRPRKPQLEKNFWKCSKATISIQCSQQPAKDVLTSLLRAMTLCAPSSEIDEVASFKESLLYAPITQLLLLPQGLLFPPPRTPWPTIVAPEPKAPPKSRGRRGLVAALLVAEAAAGCGRPGARKYKYR